VHCKYIVQGVTSSGRKFRPSDWIDRMASMGAKYVNRRLVFSDLMHPELYEGQKCLIIDAELEIKDPCMFQHVMSFVQSNDLQVTKVCDVIEKKLGS